MTEVLDLGNLLVHLNADTAAYDASLSKAERKMIQWADRMEKTGTRMMLKVTAPLVLIGRSAIKAFSEADKVTEDFNAALGRVGHNIPAVTEHFKRYADSIKQVTIYDDDVILSQMALAKNFGVQTTQLEDATTAAIGFAAKYRMELPQAMEMVAKASRGNTIGFHRLGIQVNDTMSPMEKFNYILSQGKDAFSLAQKEAKTFSGRMEIMKRDYGDAKELLGQAMVPLMLKLADAINAATKWFNSLNPATREHIVLIGAIAAAYGPALFLMSKLVSTLVLLSQTLPVAALGIGKLGIALSVVGAAIAGWQIGSYLYEEFAIVQKGGAALVAGLTKAWAYIKYGFNIMVDSIKFVWNIAITFLKNKLASLVELLAGVVGAAERAGEALGASMDLGSKALKNFASTLQKESPTTVIADYAKQVGEDTAVLQKELDDAKQVAVATFLEIDKEVAAKKKDQQANFSMDMEKVSQALPNLPDEPAQLIESPALQQMRDANFEMDKQLALVGMTNKEREREIAILDYSKSAWEAYGKGTQEASDAITEFSKKYDKLQAQMEESAPLVAMKEWAEKAGDFMRNLADVVTNAFDRAGDAVADFVITGKGNFQDLAEAFLEELQRMIIKALFAKAIGVVLGAVGGPLAGMAGEAAVSGSMSGGGGATGAHVMHSGGIVGSSSTMRNVPSSTFANAPRFHMGANEVPAILEKGERVLSKEQVAREDKQKPDSNVNVSFNVSALDAQSTASFFRRNQRTIATNLVNVIRSNHPIRKEMRGNES